MTLTIDAGNTQTKASLFQGDRCVAAACLLAADGRQLREWVRHYPVERCAISDVGDRSLSLRTLLAELEIPTLCVTGLTPAPLKNGYHTPETLGADRWAAAVGAADLLPAHPLLIIDAGTCVTYDFVAASGEYLGGNISPGLALRFAALHEHTAQLPLVDPKGATPNPGIDTPTAIRTGILTGWQDEIAGCIDRFRQAHADLQIFLTGGDAVYFSTDASLPLRREADLVARGLKVLAIYNTVGRK